MKRWTLVLISIVLVSSAATAQTEPRITRLEVGLWPEYDRPAVLVMLHGWLAADAALPATVHLPMPAQAGRPHAVAKRAPGGPLLMAQHTVDVEGNWARVNLVTDVREVRLEYYVVLPISDPNRRYVFEWPGGLDIKQVTYEVMRPTGVKDLSVKPPPTIQSVGNDGLTYYLGDLGPKARNDTFSIGMTYTKTTSTLTAVALRPPAPAVGQTPAPKPSGSGGANKWLVVLVVVLAAALAGTWIFKSSRKPQRKR